MQQQTLAVLTAPNASIPGAIVAARGLYRGGDSWTAELRAIEVRQAEWAPRPAALVIPRISEALLALVGPEEVARHHCEAPADPRDSRDNIRLVVADNHWASAAPKLREHKIRADQLMTIKAGIATPDGDIRAGTVGRMYLLDALRDNFPKVSVHLPPQRLEEYPNLVNAHELRSAVRAIQARPRLLDEESQAPGLDRHDILLLTLGMAVDDLARHGPQQQTGRINIRRRRLTSGTSLGYRRR